MLFLAYAIKLSDCESSSLADIIVNSGNKGIKRQNVVGSLKATLYSRVGKRDR